MIKTFKIQICLFFLLFFPSQKTFSQTYSDSEIKSVFIYQFALNIEWQNENSFENFKIAVYGNNAKMYSELKKISEKKKLKEKPVKVSKFGKISELIRWRPQIVYVPENKNFELKSIYETLKGKNILLISDNSTSHKYIMINFIYPDVKKISFEINKQNIVEQNLKILPKLLLLGGTQVDINELFEEQQLNLLKEKQKVELLKQKSESQKQLIKSLNKQISQKLSEIQIQKKEIQMLNNLIVKQKDTLNNVLQNIIKLQKILENKTRELQYKNEKIIQNEKLSHFQINKINESKEILKKLEDNISLKQKKINLQKNELNNQTLKLNKQKNLLIVSGIVVFIILLLLILLLLNIRSKQKINKMLIYRNIEVEEKNREIQKQADELLKHRNHLEQLVEDRTKELKAAKIKAEESDKLKSAFLANMSHEIRTPMNAVIGFANLLKNNNYNKAKRDELISYILKSSNTLLQLINDIIDISKIEAGQLNIFKSEFSLNELISDIKIFYEERNKLNPQVELLIKENDVDKIIYSDKLRLQQVLINLIDNALKFTEEGFVKVKYEVKQNNNKEEIVFLVSDTGKGINKEDLEDIFNRFTKLEKEDDKLYRGAGLGLSISKNIVELLGGKIWVNSEIGKGTAFYFSIPL